MRVARSLAKGYSAGMSLASEIPWYDAAFGAEYLEVYAHRDLAEARRDLEALRERGLAGPFLDLGCGAGRHLVAARELGLAGVGIDRSPALLGRAREQGLAVLRGDLRSLPIDSASFSFVTCLFSSFGYFDADGDRAQLAEVGRVLRPGGWLWLDVADPASVRAGLVPESRRQVGSRTLVERRSLSTDGRRVRKDVRLEVADQRAVSWTEDLALYEPEELERLLAEAGLRVEERWSALGGAGAIGAAPPIASRQVLRARRR